MTTIAEKLTAINKCKEDIRKAIVSKGIIVSSELPLSRYADKIRLIEGITTEGNFQITPQEIFDITYQSEVNILSETNIRILDTLPSLEPIFNNV